MILSIIVFSPLLAAIIVLLLPQRLRASYRWVTLVASVWQLVWVASAFMQLDYGSQARVGVNQMETLQLSELVPWITFSLGSLGNISISYFLAVDGLNGYLLLLSAIIMLIGAISSFEIKKKEKGYHALFLILNAAIHGCFLAFDFFLFYLFFEFMLLPMYFLIGIWGGARREYASIKFFIYTLAGSILILMVMIGLYSSVIDPVSTAVNMGLTQSPSEVSQETIAEVQQLLEQGSIAQEHMVRTFNLIYMMDVKNFVPDSIFAPTSMSLLGGEHARLVAFLLLLIGFAIKLPAVPFHTWLPDAHVEAPTAISVILAGVLLKIGGYGILRIAYSIFPEGALYYAWWIGLFGVLAIIYAAFVALGTHNLKKLIAYSSVSHMGFVLLGIASLTQEGISGAVFQMFSHGIISAMLFLVAGVLYYRQKHLEIESYKGLMAKMPRYATFVVIAFFASLGLPGFSGFIAEIMVLLGAFRSQVSNALIPVWMPLIAITGLVITAAYYLWTLQRMFLGDFWKKPDLQEAGFHDLSARETSMLVPLAIMTVLLGVFPHLLFQYTEASVIHFVQQVMEAGESGLQLIMNAPD